MKKVENKKISQYLSEINDLEFVEGDEYEATPQSDPDNLDLDDLQEIPGEDTQEGTESDNDNNQDSDIDTDSDNLSIQSFNSDMSIEDSLRYLHYVTVNNFPVQLVCLEKLEATLDNLIENGYDIC